MVLAIINNVFIICVVAFLMSSLFGEDCSCSLPLWAAAKDTVPSLMNAGKDKVNRIAASCKQRIGLKAVLSWWQRWWTFVLRTLAVA